VLLPTFLTPIHQSEKVCLALWVPAAHSYNPSYLGGRDQEDHSCPEFKLQSEEGRGGEEKEEEGRGGEGREGKGSLPSIVPA
jgi:hypothetical protein